MKGIDLNDSLGLNRKSGSCFALQKDKMMRGVQHEKEFLV